MPRVGTSASALWDGRPPSLGVGMDPRLLRGAVYRHQAAVTQELVLWEHGGIGRALLGAPLLAFLEPGGGQSRGEAAQGMWERSLGHRAGFSPLTHESAFPKGNTHPKKQKCGSLTASDGNSALWGTFLWGTVLLGRVVGMRKAVHLQGILPGILPPTDLQIT